jgi:outer membrane lipoprotein
LEQVRYHPERHLNAPVRWGGEVISVENRPQETWVEFLAYPLGNEGRPRYHRSSEGRFLGRFAGFLDPAVIKPGRGMTVSGTAEGVVTRNVGEYPYRFPLVKVQVYHLWPPRQTYPRYDPWYDPFYDPFYNPWYPYYRPPYYRYPYWW